MYKKQLITSLLFVCLLGHLTAFEGLYIGGSVGGSLTEADQNGSSFGSYDPGFIVADYQSDFAPTIIDYSVEAGVFLGYGFSWNTLYLGIEGFVQYNPASLENEEAATNTNFSTAASFFHDTFTDVRVSPWEYGLDCRPGWIITPATLLYGRIGFNVTTLKLNLESANSGFALGDTWSLPLEASAEKTRLALRLGGGVEQRLSSRFTLRADYVYTDYGTINTADQTAGTSAGANLVLLSSSTQEHLYNHSLQLGLTYHCQPLCCDLWSPCGDAYFCGFYIGGGIGGGYLVSELDGGATGGQFSNPVLHITEISPYLRDIPFQGNLFLGYGWQKSCFYLGSEFFALGATTKWQENDDLSAYQDDPNMNNFSLELISRTRVSPWQFGIDLCPGLLIKPTTLLYGRIGMSIATLQMNSQANLLGAIPLSGQTWDLSNSDSQKVTRAVLRLGGGLEQNLCSKLNLRLDYCYTNYRELEVEERRIGQSSSGAPLLLDNITSAKIKGHALLLNLVWHFN